MRQFDGERAAASFRAALALSADLKEGWIGLSWSLRMLGKFDEASTHLIRIYLLDQPFYHAWNCDFLLGECRRAGGKG